MMMMKTLMKVLIPAAFLAVLADPAGSRQAEAGEGYPLPAGCNNNGVKGGMRCWGTLRGFRASPSTGAYAMFDTGYAADGTPTRTFGARFNGVGYSCTIIPWIVPDDVYTAMTANIDVNFTIVSGMDGACRVERLTSTSYYLP